MAALKRKQRELEEATAAQSAELIGEDADADQEFWGQDAWKEDESEYSTEAEEQDVFDSDFNESEESGGEDEEQSEESGGEDEEQVEVYSEVRGQGSQNKGSGGEDDEQEPKKPKAPPKKKAVEAAALGEGGEDVGAGDVTAMDDLGGYAPERSMRTTTKTKTEVSAKVREQGLRQAQRKGAEQQPQAAARAFRLTQEQMLLEAASETEHANTNWVAQQRRLAEEAQDGEHASTNGVAQQRRPAEEAQQRRLAEEAQDLETQPRQHMPFISRFYSKRGAPCTVTFPAVDLVPSVLKGPHPAPITPQQRAQRTLCKVTGRPAKYRDSLTGYPFADAAAFRELRRRYGAAPTPTPAESSLAAPYLAAAEHTPLRAAALPAKPSTKGKGRPKGARGGKRGGKGGRGGGRKAAHSCLIAR
ncbi:hypothetical protein JKP88DRAFT_348257 [Tribonema minus]|uniref:Vps72/YL1 C-terminal domain-containing protein n=1 Tax=Tribonema minus TaxID=303371 RepID=A0A836CH45_9STRA|nr:hypothetical protein JKP88DRAFT_348257 [Tribonema minus]